MIAADLTVEDPVEAYATDLLIDPITDVRDRELALGYVRAARRYRALDPAEFFAEFPEVVRAAGQLGQKPSDAITRLHDLHRRHGERIAPVVEGFLSDAIGRADSEPPGPESLPALIGRDVFGSGQLPLLKPSNMNAATIQKAVTFELSGGRDRPTISVQGVGEIKGASGEVLMFFAKNYLKAEGDGRRPEDHPFVAARKLQDAWRLKNEDSVRRRISNARRQISKKLRNAGHPDTALEDIVENIGWRGYRLNPTNCKVYRSSSNE